MKRLLIVVLLCMAPLVLGAAVRVPIRELSFGGLHWRLKSSLTLTSPGPNYYRDKEDAVWVDEQGLHLTIQKIDSIWWATEIFTRERVGYGTYTFTVETPSRSYEPQVVAGFYTWDTDSAEFNREIDIEFAAWGEPTGTKFQYVVQPYTQEDRIHVFDPDLQGDRTTHRIVWTKQGITFSSYHGQVDPDDPASEAMLIERWTYPDSPSEGKVRFRINLWLYQGRMPTKPVDLLITAFSFEKGKV
jgi:hypothetical protein